MGLFKPKPGAFGANMSAGGDPTRSQQDWQKGGGPPPPETQTLNRYYRCEVCGGYFVLQQTGDPFNTNFDLAFDVALRRLRQLHGGLDLCLGCEGAGVTAGNLTDKVKADRIAWRKDNPQREWERQFKAQERTRR